MKIYIEGCCFELLNATVNFSDVWRGKGSGCMCCSGTDFFAVFFSANGIDSFLTVVFNN